MFQSPYAFLLDQDLQCNTYSRIPRLSILFELKEKRFPLEYTLAMTIAGRVEHSPVHNSSIFSPYSIQLNRSKAIPLLLSRNLMNSIVESCLFSEALLLKTDPCAADCFSLSQSDSISLGIAGGASCPAPHCSASGGSRQLEQPGGLKVTITAVS